MSNHILCDSCGTDLTVDKVEPEEVGKTNSLIAISLSVEVNHPEADRVKETFGKTSFNICYCCVIKSLGVKEVKK